jgi:hypothetical protein
MVGKSRSRTTRLILIAVGRHLTLTAAEFERLVSLRWILFELFLLGNTKCTSSSCEVNINPPPFFVSSLLFHSRSWNTGMELEGSDIRRHLVGYRSDILTTSFGSQSTLILIATRRDRSDVFPSSVGEHRGYSAEIRQSRSF